MSYPFPAVDPGKSLRWAVLIALLIDVPFLLTLVLSSGDSQSILFIVMIIPLALSSLIIYSSYATGKMVYIIDADELRIIFPLSPLRIHYDKIKSAGKVETSLRFRLFGGSLPGSHWGLFTTSNLGNTQVYATRSKGNFVLLELEDGVKVLITPRESDAFLNALKNKVTFTAPALAPIVEPRLDRRFVYTQTAIVAVTWLALFFYAASIYPGLPEIIPVHFGFNGVPNRYGSKVELLVLVAVSAIFPILNTVFAFKFGKYNKSLNMFLSVVFALAIGLFALIIYQIQQAI
jgi:hypothetical protein